MSSGIRAVLIETLDTPKAEHRHELSGLLFNSVGVPIVCKIKSRLPDSKQANAGQARLYYIHHEVMITRFHALLELGCKASRGNVELATWQQRSALHRRVETPKVSFYDGLWRMGEGVQQQPLRPDAFFRLHFPTNPEGQQYASFFYEADRKTTAETERIIKKPRSLSLRCYKEAPPGPQQH